MILDAMSPKNEGCYRYVIDCPINGGVADEEEEGWASGGCPPGQQSPWAAKWAAEWIIWIKKLFYYDQQFLKFW